MDAVEVQQARVAPWRNLLALLLGPGLIYGLMIYFSLKAFLRPDAYMQLDQVKGLMRGIFIYFFVFCGWLWLLLQLLCRERLADLQLWRASLGRDLWHAAALLLLKLVGLDWLNEVLAAYLYSFGLSTSLVQFMEEAAARDPLTFWLALLPYSWLAAAVFEEFLRVFMLSRLLRLSDSLVMRIASVFLGGLLFGLCHIYQGLEGIISAFIMGLLFSAYYVVYGRVWPLILVHGLYDTYAKLAWYYWPTTSAGG